MASKTKVTALFLTGGKTEQLIVDCFLGEHLGGPYVILAPEKFDAYLPICEIVISCSAIKTAYLVKSSLEISLGGAEKIACFTFPSAEIAKMVADLEIT